MKRIFRIFLIVAVALTAVIAMLNISVTTRQGVDFNVHTIRIPLYLKMLDFFDRHYNYKQLVKEIIKDERDEQKKVIKILSWVHSNIKKQPDSLPVIDDHVWHIIVRGYGIIDQSNDVFTTLCNYAGVDAFYALMYAQDRTQKIPLSFVKVKGRWTIFDPYRGIYFKDKKDNLAEIKVIKSKDFIIENIGKEASPDYKGYFNNLLTIKEIGLKRANIQSPLRRLMYEMSKWMK